MFNFIKRRLDKDKSLQEQFLDADLEDDLKYLKMSLEELCSLSDEDLYAAIVIKIEHKIEKYDDLVEGMRHLSNAERTFYVCQYYEMEVNNGGLCQFFVNSSRQVAPFLSNCLKTIGAIEHKELFDSFISNNNIDVKHLDSFIIYKVKDFEKQMARYPFDMFDDAFYNLEPLDQKLISYIRKNLNDF